MVTEAPLLEVEGLRKVFRGRGRTGRDTVAVRDVSFALAPGASLAIVGESGSGKTTIARMLVGLERPTAGAIRFGGRERAGPARGRAERLRRGREAQIVFQDPYGSLDPRQRVDACIGEALRLHFPLSRPERDARTAELLSQVGLGAREARALPRELSGGQRQRVAIARALASRPSLLILDEAVSALDVSIQAQILNLLAEIRRATGVACIVVSHDLAVVRQVTESAIVLYRGSVVEAAPTDRLLEHPAHPYTRLLLESVPRPGWSPAARRVAAAAGDAGECPFRPRCPAAYEPCSTEPPVLTAGQRAARCWLAAP